MCISTVSLRPRWLAEGLFSPRPVILLLNEPPPSGALAQYVFKTIEGVIAVLDSGELPSGAGLLRPPCVLQLKGEDTQPRGEPYLPVLEILPTNLRPRFEGVEVGH